MPPVIETHELSKVYGAFSALKDVSFTASAGEIFALLGPNGAGKTTTIRLLMGILVPSRGTAQICGQDCFKDRVEVKRRVGYVPDEPVFYDFLKGREIIEFSSDLRGFSRAECLLRTRSLIERLEMAEALEEFAVNYSRGMKKKLALICAFLHQPELLILDEPTNGLDPLATRVLMELIQERAREGSSVFYSTHLLDQAEKLCNRVAIIMKGALVACDSIERLRKSSSQTLEEIFMAATQSAAAQ